MHSALKTGEGPSFEPNQAPKQEAPKPEPGLRARRAALTGGLFSALGLTGCGSGHPPTISLPASDSSQVSPMPTTLDLKSASRLVAQTSFGTTRADIDRAHSVGAAAWVDEQLALPRGQSHVAWLYEQGYQAIEHQRSPAGATFSAWRAFLSRPDQLRQRMVYALSQIMVISLGGIGNSWPSFAAAYYLDCLDEHALGNFRALLEAVTLSPAMGTYLSMRGSRKADASGRQPDENYAREIMQLFTIGLHQLAPDGSIRYQNGQPLETYSAADVTGLARVFTGWDVTTTADQADTTPVRQITPMQHYAGRHESGEKSFLNTTIAAGTSGPASLAMALDTLANHPNVGPFIGRQLIQRFVTANPSPEYVQRVAAAFARDANGVRGNLAHVLRQVLLDPEAQQPSTAAGAGKLIEPFLRFTQWARATNVRSPSGTWKIRNLNDARAGVAQSPLSAPSVFNFYRPGYKPPGTRLAAANLLSPEMQITTETSVAGYLNTMQAAISSVNNLFGSDAVPDWGPWMTLADNAAALVDELDLVLAAQRMSAATRGIVIQAVESVPGGSTSGRLNRVRIATMLIVASPEYFVTV